MSSSKILDGIFASTEDVAHNSYNIELGAFSTHTIHADSIVGGSGGESIDVTVSGETYIGAGGDDIFHVYVSDVTLSGGEGTDTADFSPFGESVTISLANAGPQALGEGSVTLDTIENLIGGEAADHLTGNEGANSIAGGGGADTLVATAGGDTLDGGEGADTADYSGATGGATIDLGAGTADWGQQPQAGPHQLHTDTIAWHDTLVSIENVIGSGEADHITGSEAANSIDGAGGADTLVATGGSDTLNGNSGNDTADFSRFDGVTVDLGQTGAQEFGGGTVTLVSIENVIGSEGGDDLTGDSGSNSLAGGFGADTFHISGGADTFNGGEGSDTLSLASVSTGGEFELGAHQPGAAGFTVSLNTGAAQSVGDGSVTLISIENLIGGEGADTFTGNASDNSLAGAGGDDTLIEQGFVSVTGSFGDDTLNGGEGTDTASYAYVNVGVTVNLGDGTADAISQQSSGPNHLHTDVTVTGTSFHDVLYSIENVTGSNYADSITGSEGANNIVAGGGADTIVATGGADTYAGGEGVDTVDYSHMSGGAVINLNGGQAYSTTEVYVGGEGEFYENTLTSVHKMDGEFAPAWSHSLSGVENAIGTDSDDTITGSTAVNHLWGGEGNDVLVNGGAGSSLGNDTFDGGGGNDTVSFAPVNSGVTVNLGSGEAWSGVEVNGAALHADTVESGWHDSLVSIENVIGSEYGDVITGSEGANSIDAGGGYDTIYATIGNDTINGGEGFDTVSYEASDTAVTVDLSAGTATFLQNQPDGAAHDPAPPQVWTQTLQSIEAVYGGEFNDSLTGNSGENALYGQGGNDTLDAGSDGEDYLDGGEGNDTVSFASSTSGVHVDMGIQNEWQEVDGNQVFGAHTPLPDGREVCLSSIENIVGSAFDDVITAGESGSISGAGGNDLIYAIPDEFYSNAARPGAHLNPDYEVSHSFDGGTGIDTLSFQGAEFGVYVDLSQHIATSENGNTGAHQPNVSFQATVTNIENVIGGEWSDTIIGDSGSNFLAGGRGSDELVGGGGDDTLEGGLGWDFMDGGEGSDMVSYADAQSSVIVDLSQGSATGGEGDVEKFQAGAKGQQNSGDILVSIENATGSAFADVLIGSDGANVLNGGAGDDLIIGGLGADVINGGEGNDTASFVGLLTGVTVDMNAHTAVAGGETDTLVSIENIIGGAFDDIIYGDGANNSLLGGQGDDLLNGGGGADTLNGGEGSDTASFTGAGSGVTADLAAGTASTALGVNDTLISIENLIGSGYDDSLSGDNHANTIQGLAGNDAIAGHGGADMLEGGGGDDTLEGGLGADTLEGGAGSDTATFANANAAETVSLQLGTATGGDGSDTLKNIENVVGSDFADSITGNGKANVLDGGDGNDVLSGANGRDTIDGGAGNDTIDSGRGADHLTGGEGADVFVYNSLHDLRVGHDLITDLSNEDSIDLSQIKVMAHHQPVTFHVVDAFDGQKGEIVISYDATHDVTTFAFDLNADGQADGAITASGDHTDFTNFVV